VPRNGDGNIMPNTDKSHFIFTASNGTWGVWVIILIVLLLILGWLLLAPLQLQIDTRIPEISFRWISVGKAKMVYEQGKWWLKISVFFFFKQWELEDLIFKPKKKVKKTRPKTKTGHSKWFRKLLNLIKTFRVTKWRIAIDTGDDVRNAWLYSLNFYPGIGRHVSVNFFDENYLLLEIRNAPWKIIYALTK
jgi:hypothetical protein